MESNGYKVYTALNGASAYEIVTKEKIDLAVLDIMMPEMDGYQLTVKIREQYNFPIIFLSAKNQDNDKILGLNMGADDYMTKPFNPLEIIARVNSSLRRTYQLNTNENVKEDSSYRVGELELNTDRISVSKGGESVTLTPTEFKILALLMKNPGRVYTKAQIYEAINGECFESDENAIMVHISKLREKIKDDSKSPEYIKNIRGLGYKIEKK